MKDSDKLDMPRNATAKQSSVLQKFLQDTVSEGLIGIFSVQGVEEYLCAYFSIVKI